MLAKDEILEFQRLVREVYLRELTVEEANDQGSRLVRLFELKLKNMAIVNGGLEVIQND